jgi:hypothetical membrane protein
VHSGTQAWASKPSGESTQSARKRGTSIDNIRTPGSARDPARGRRYAVAAAAVWIAAGGAYLVLEAATAARFRPHYSYADNYISDLGVTPAGMLHGRLVDSPLAHLMNAAFYVQGTFFLLGAILVACAVRPRTAGLFVTFAALNAVGNILVGTIHSGPAAAADGIAWLHVAGAAGAIAGGNLAILAGTDLVRKAGAAPWFRAPSLGLASVGLLSLAMLVIDSTTASVHLLPVGVWERGSVYSIIAWQTLAGGYLIRLARMGSDALVRGQ